MGLFEISEFASWASLSMGPNSNNPTPDLKYPFEDLPILATCLYTSVSAETVKLNFRLELQATSTSNLNNGRTLNCKFGANRLHSKS